MIITRHLLLKKLIDNKVIKNKKLSTKFQQILNNNPNLTQLVVEYTSFLKYSAPLNVRIQCIIQNINQQPLCINCNNPTSMRTYNPGIYTFNKYCSKRCSSSSEIASKKRKQSIMKKYGVDNIFKVKEIRTRAKKTMIEKYGVEHAMQNQEIQAKMHGTMIEKYGVEHAGLMEDFKDKVSETSIKKYGANHPMLNAEILEKKNKTMVEKYGVPNPMHNQDLLEKRNSTNLEKYQHSSPLMNEKVRKKIIKSNLEKYGVEYPLQSPTIKEKATNALKEKYGTTNNWNIPGVREKRKQKSLEKYGVEYPIMNILVKERIKNVILQKYDNKHFKQQHISEETINNLNDKTWLTEQHHTKKKTIKKITDEIDVVSPATTGRYFKKYNVDVLSHSSSQGERDIAAYIRSIYSGTVLTNVRDVIRPLELDVYLPDLKIAFEYNGIFWHGEKQGKDRTYHLNKLQRCAEEGIRLIQITDAEWLTKQEIVQSRISSIVHNNSTIYARKTTIRQLSARESSVFFRETHIQGTAGQAICYGLVYEGEIVAAMSFGKARYTNGVDWELIRYANKLYTSVVGGASKLFSHFIKTHDAKSIVTYSDKRWNTGRLYKNLGFTFVHAAAPNYYYFRPIDTTKLYHRSQFQKHKLANKLEMFDPTLTEWENMKLNGYDRIWDCGNDVYVYDAKSNI